MDFPRQNNGEPQVLVFTQKETQALVQLRSQLAISPLTLSPVFTLHNSIFVSPHCQLS
jgi:hypothetical protein